MSLLWFIITMTIDFILAAMMMVMFAGNLNSDHWLLAGIALPLSWVNFRQGADKAVYLWKAITK